MRSVNLMYILLVMVSIVAMIGFGQVMQGNAATVRICQTWCNGWDCEQDVPCSLTCDFGPPLDFNCKWYNCPWNYQGEWCPPDTSK